MLIAFHAISGHVCVAMLVASHGCPDVCTFVFSFDANIWNFVEHIFSRDTSYISMNNKYFSLTTYHATQELVFFLSGERSWLELARLLARRAGQKSRAPVSSNCTWGAWQQARLALTKTHRDQERVLCQMRRVLCQMRRQRLGRAREPRRPQRRAPLAGHSPCPGWAIQSKEMGRSKTTSRKMDSSFITKRRCENVESTRVPRRAV